MKNEKFKVIQFIRDFLIYIDKDMDNFPKKDIELKNRIRTSSYDILELAYIANTEEDISEKRKYILQIIAKIKIIDFLLNVSYDKKIITQKKYYKFANKIDDILKFSMGWLKSTK